MGLRIECQRIFACAAPTKRPLKRTEISSVDLAFKVRLRIKLMRSICVGEIGMASGSPIVNFLSGSGSDHRGRSLEEVLALSDSELESRHDFIQWLFPLDTPSAAVPGSPVLSSNDIAEIRGCQQCRANLLRASDRMRRFYAENDHWLVRFDHNHRRITRIIKSLSLLVGNQEAEEFYRFIEERVAETNAPVSATSRRFWRNAIGEA